MKDKTLSSNYSFKGTIWLFMLVLSSFMYVANAQQRNVQGMVTDPNGEPIIGASVVVKGTTNGTITDFDGKFTLSNVPEKGIITITYIGYKGQDIPVAGKSTLKVTLAEDTETLDEVVVVGYGVQKKSDVTGAMIRVRRIEIILHRIVVRRSRNHHKVRLPVSRSPVERSRQVQFLFRQILLDILILNRADTVVNLLHFFRNHVYSHHPVMLCQQRSDRQTYIARTRYSDCIVFHHGNALLFIPANKLSS